MSRRPRRNHIPAFKAKLALAAVKGEITLAQLVHHACSLTPADAPLIDAENLFTQPGPPHTWLEREMQ